MANGEWLTQLMSGLGGAFTGETMARERIALEAEQERKRQEEERRQEEAANERERLRQIQELRRQPFTKELGQQLLGLGDTPQSVAALQDIFVPKTPRKPLIEGVGKDNRRYTFDPNTGETTVSPFEEYRAPREPKSEGPTAAETRAERRTAETAFRGATGDVQRRIRTQPKLADKKYEGLTSSAARDTASFLQDRAGFDADTAFSMEQARLAAQDPSLSPERRQEMSGLLAILSGQKPPQMSPTASAEQEETLAAQQAITRVMASAVPDAQKRAAVQAINDELKRAILEIRSGR